MGLVSSLSSVPAEHVDRLLIVDNKWSELEKKKHDAEKRKAGKKGKGRRR